MVLRLHRRNIRWEKGAFFKYLYFLAVFWMMCASMNLSFTRMIPISLSYGVAILFCLAMLYFEKALRTWDYIIFEALLLWLCLHLFLVSQFSIGGLLWPVSVCLGILTIIRLPESDKRSFLAIITDVIVFILCFSLFGWFLYLAGFPLPHTGVIDIGDNFHYLVDYYFFTVSENADAGVSGLLPRFSSVFLEPGQLATPCAILLFSNGNRLAVWKRLVLIISILLSFSLVGYGLIIGGYGLKTILEGKHRFLKLAIAFAILTPGALFVYLAADENNPIYARIFMRLEYDEDKGISGNNRTSDEFDQRFDRMMHSSDKWFGIAKQVGHNDNWVSNASGYKKFLVFYGLIGMILLWTFHLWMLRMNKCPASWVLFMVLLVGFIPRSMLPSPLWEFPAVLGFFLHGADARAVRPEQKPARRKRRIKYLISPVSETA